MCVDAGISQRTDYGVHVPIWIFNLFSQTNICYIDSIALCANTHEQIVWLDISVDVPLRMNKLEAGDELVCKQQHSLE